MSEPAAPTAEQIEAHLEAQWAASQRRQAEREACGVWLAAPIYIDPDTLVIEFDFYATTGEGGVTSLRLAYGPDSTDHTELIDIMVRLHPRDVERINRHLTRWCQMRQGTPPGA